MLKKFDFINVENGMILTAKDGTRYVSVNGKGYNCNLDSDHAFDYIVYNRDGTCPKFKSGEKDIVKVSVVDCVPTANRISEAFKIASGRQSKYREYDIYTKPSDTDTTELRFTIIRTDISDIPEIDKAIMLAKRG